MDKPVNHLGYQSQRTQKCRQLLITIFRKLGPWRDKLVLVGGLVPFLRFEDSEHVGTTDIDLVLNPLEIEDVESYRTLEQNFKRIGLKRGLNPNKQAQHFRWTLNDDNGNETASVDLLCPSSEAEAGRILPLRDHGERRLSALGIPGARLVFDDFEEIELSGELLGGRGLTQVKVKVVGLVTYIVMKALAFKERCEPKDAYDLIHVMIHHEGGPTALGQAFAHKMSNKPEEDLYPRALEILKQSFLDENNISGADKEGPVHYALFLHPSDQEEQAISRQDAVAIVSEFVRSASLG